MSESLSSAIIIHFKKIYNFQILSEVDVQNLLLGLQGLQIALKNAAQNKEEDSTAKPQQHNSPESTTMHDMSTMVEPIKKMTDLIKARTPQHLSSESNYSFPNMACKQQTSPGISPAKKRIKELHAEKMDTATTLPDAISK